MSMNEDRPIHSCVACGSPLADDELVMSPQMPGEYLCADCATEDDAATQEDPMQAFRDLRADRLGGSREAPTMHQEAWTPPPDDANSEHTCPECGGTLVPYMNDAWTCTDCSETWTNDELVGAEELGGSTTHEERMGTAGPVYDGHNDPGNDVFRGPGGRYEEAFHSRYGDVDDEVDTRYASVDNDAALSDRAYEWVGVNYPDLDGPEFDAKVQETIADLSAMDDANDAAVPDEMYEADSDDDEHPDMKAARESLVCKNCGSRKINGNGLCTDCGDDWYAKPSRSTDRLPKGFYGEGRELNEVEDYSTKALAHNQPLIRLGYLYASIGGDRRYMDYLKLTYDPATDTATVTVSSSGAAGGMDTFNGSTEPRVDYKRTSKPGVTARDIMTLLGDPLSDRNFNFKQYGKPTKNFMWSTGAKGLSAKLATQALANAKAHEVQESKLYEEDQKFQCHACGGHNESQVEFVCAQCGHDNSEDDEQLTLASKMKIPQHYEAFHPRHSDVDDLENPTLDLPYSGPDQTVGNCETCDGTGSASDAGTRVKCWDCGGTGDKLHEYVNPDEGLFFDIDKHIDAILIKEARGQEIKQPETANRKMDKKYRERPANRTRFVSGGR